MKLIIHLFFYLAIASSLLGETKVTCAANHDSISTSINPYKVLGVPKNASQDEIKKVSSKKYLSLVTALI